MFLPFFFAFVSPNLIGVDYDNSDEGQVSQLYWESQLTPNKSQRACLWGGKSCAFLRRTNWQSEI